jgi:hypothetical protein
VDTINGYEALKRMRALRHSKDQSFIMHHQTWNERRHETNGIRVVRRCRLRPALPEESMLPHPDLFQPYTDLDAPKINRNRMCRKRLIRYVAFPPDFTLMKVDWFTPLADGKPQIIHYE